MRENKYKKSINGTGGKEQPHDVSSSGHFKEQSESLEKNGEFEAVEAKNFYELFMNLDVGAIEQQEKSLIDQVDKLVKHLEDMVSTGRAELFLACDIDRGAFFSYFRQALQNNAQYEAIKQELGDMSEFEKEWSLPMVETLCRLRYRFVQFLQQKVEANPSLKDKVVFGDKKKKLGAGGMGSVHTFGVVSEAPRSGEHVMGYFVPEHMPVTIKVFERYVRTDFDPVAVERLLSVRDPNVVSFLGYHRLGDRVVALQEYVEGGRSFKEVLDEVFEGKLNLTPVDILDVVEKTIDGTLALNKAGLAHLDLKSANVICVGDASGRIRTVKVLDFDLARRLELPNDPENEPLIGTPGLIAPERNSAGVLLNKADVYSVGALLCSILYDKVPNTMVKYFSPDEFFDRQIIPHVPEKIRSKLSRLIEIDPKNRATLEQAKLLVSELKSMAQGECLKYFEDLITQRKENKLRKKLPTDELVSEAQESQSSHSIDIPLIPYAPAELIRQIHQIPQKSQSAELLFQAGLAKESLGALRDAKALYEMAVSKNANTAFLFHLNRVVDKIEKK